MTALTTWTEPFDMPAFSKVRDDMFAPAFEAALAEARADVAAIAADPAPATFENTIEAMARAGEDLDKVLSIFYTISGAVSNDTREALSRDFSPALADYSSEISLNADLFARYQALWDQRANLDLTAEQARVLELSYKNYVRAGALLEGRSCALRKRSNHALPALEPRLVRTFCLMSGLGLWSLPKLI